jgi:hypothetical protein
MLLECCYTAAANKTASDASLHVINTTADHTKSTPLLPQLHYGTMAAVLQAYFCITGSPQ